MNYKGNYLRNIGYIGEQIDLYLASKNIGALWFGIGKPDQTEVEGLNYVIMIAIAKIPARSWKFTVTKNLESVELCLQKKFVL